MEDVLTLLGAEELIRKTEFMRIIVQCLYSLGYSKSAYCLEIESGIRCRSEEFELLESQILNGSWDACICTLNSLEDLTDGTKASALFLVYEQGIMEFLKQGNDSSALGILRKEISTSGLDRGKVQKLASTILSSKEVKFCVMNDRVHESRKNLVTDLENLLPPRYVLPERRLESLVEAVVTSQIDRCVYHNSSDGASLYEDHCCNGNQLPTETIPVGGARGIEALESTADE